MKSSKTHRNPDEAGLDWRVKTLADVRRLIVEADPEIVEERKWIKPTNPAGVPVWSHAGIVCTGETYKQAVKLTFARGAALQDPHKLFNAGLEGNVRRAIDISQGMTLDATAFKALIREAVALNEEFQSAKGKPGQKAISKALPERTTKPKPRRAASSDKVVLLTGGNPQIAKGDGDAPVQAFIAAMPGWKQDVGRRLDALISRLLPKARKAVKWNTPFYGVEGEGFFLGFHCMTKYVKVAFFNGASLDPMPPVESKQKAVRYLHIHENEAIDEKQLARWIKQASKMPGWTP